MGEGDLRVSLGRQVTVVNPTQDILDWCDRNLVIANPDYAKKQRLGFYLGSTPKKLYLYERDGDKLRMPYGCVWNIYPYIKNAGAQVESDFEEQPVIEEMEDTIPLYDYQKEAVEAMMKSGHGILKSCAGSGKTQMGLSMILRHKKKALWLAHTIDLVKQSMKRAAKYMPKEKLGTIMDGKVDIGEWITFSTVQTLSSLDMSEYRDTWDVIIVDECHHVSGTPYGMKMFARVLTSLSARHKYGLSATVYRSDGLIFTTYAMLGTVQFTVDDDKVVDRVLQVRIKPVPLLTPDVPEIHDPSGQMDYVKMISYLADDFDRNDAIINKIMENYGKSCLILSDRVGQLRYLKDSLPDDMRKQAVVVTGKSTKKDEREKAINDMNSGKKLYLFATFQLAKEGLDIPRLERVFMATPVKDVVSVTQMLGRVARVYKGKAEPWLYDVIDFQIPWCQKAYRYRQKLYRHRKCLWDKYEV